MPVALKTSDAAAQSAPASSVPDEGRATANALEEFTCAHRQALRELAPHQAWRSVREDTAWHMEKLGLLLRVRETTRAGEEDDQRHRPL